MNYLYYYPYVAHQKRFRGTNAVRSQRGGLSASWLKRTGQRVPVLAFNSVRIWSATCLSCPGD